MSKKKSYMNRENILTEGFFSKFKSWFKSLPKQPTEKKKRVSRALKSQTSVLNKSIDRYEILIKKQLGDDYPDLPRFEPEDFIR